MDKSRLQTMQRDYYGGGLILAIGLLTIGIGSDYPIGHLSRMGPGYFPVVLGVLLSVVGLGIIFAAWLASGPGQARAETPFRPQWRGWACITASLAAFVVLGTYGGFVPATIAVTFISAMADRGNSVRSAVLLTAAMVVVLIVVFWWALQMPFPLFGWGPQ